MKFHLRTVVENSKLTSEEFYTLRCQVEAVLNSRPLCPLSNDPDNLQVLTPGLFLISTSLLALPDHNLVDLSSNRLSKWSRVQQMVHDCGSAGLMITFISCNRGISGKKSSQMQQLVM
jgi:hypothetical protein